MTLRQRAAAHPGPWGHPGPFKEFSEGRGEIQGPPQSSQRGVNGAFRALRKVPWEGGCIKTFQKEFPEVEK